MCGCSLDTGQFSALVTAVVKLGGGEGGGEEGKKQAFT